MNLGLLYKNTPRQNKKPDYASALKYLGMACNMNNGLACGYLGLMHEKGEGVERSYRRGKEFYEKSCSLKSSFGCDMAQKLDDI
jgi:TPR repeat protein